MEAWRTRLILLPGRVAIANHPLASLFAYTSPTASWTRKYLAKDHNKIDKSVNNKKTPNIFFMYLAGKVA
jgi:hypothetical protein